jgi:hypothetical protein
MLNKILCVAVLGLFAGLARADTQAPTQAAAAPTGRIKGQIIAARVQGHVTAVSKTNVDGQLLHDGDHVTEDSTVVTAAGASVILVFSNGATLDLAGDTRLKIEEFEQDPFSTEIKASEMKQEPGTSVTKLYLTKGELVGRVAHLNVDKGSEFTVRDPVGAAGIRGTFFKVIFLIEKHHKARLTLETFEGLIVFTGLASGPLDIPAGRKYEGEFDYNPTDPDNPGDWLPPASLILQALFISPQEAAEFQGELQKILDALNLIVFPNGLPPPPPSPKLNAPTPGAGTGT